MHVGRLRKVVVGHNGLDQALVLLEAEHAAAEQALDFALVVLQIAVGPFGHEPKSSRKRSIWCIRSCRMVTMPMSPLESRRQ